MLYTPDERDTVIAETDLPAPLGGAPIPTVFATEHRLLLGYYIRLWDPEPARRRTMPNLVSESSLGTITVADFRRPVAFFSTPVSNEAFDAHPLAFRGLAGDGVFRVENSSLIRRLLAIRHAPGAFSEMKHYIFVFHDSIFEVCRRVHAGRGKRDAAIAAKESGLNTGGRVSWTIQL
jgi:hypothetical protein